MRGFYSSKFPCYDFFGNRYSDFYDIHDGEWGWFDTNIDEDREQFIVREIPLTTDKWFFNVFSISKTHGIGIIDNPIAFDSIRPVHFLCEGPHSVHRGESIGIRCMIMNRSRLTTITNSFLYHG